MICRLIFQDFYSEQVMLLVVESQEQVSTRTFICDTPLD